MLLCAPPWFGTVKIVQLAVVGTAADAASSTGTLAIPAPNAGDVLLAVYRMTSGAGNPSDATPSGWTKLATAIATAVGSNQPRWSAFAKIADGSETTLPFLGGGNGNRRVCWVLRGNVPAKSIAVASPGSWDNVSSTDGDPSSQVVATASGEYPQIGLGVFGNDSGTAVAPRSSTPALTSELNSGTFVYAGIHLFNVGDTPSNMTVDMDDEGNANFLASLKISVT